MRYLAGGFVLIIFVFWTGMLFIDDFATYVDGIFERHRSFGALAGSTVSGIFTVFMGILISNKKEDEFKKEIIYSAKKEAEYEKVYLIDLFKKQELYFARYYLEWFDLIKKNRIKYGDGSSEGYSDIFKNDYIRILDKCMPSLEMALKIAKIENYKENFYPEINCEHNSIFDCPREINFSVTSDNLSTVYVLLGKNSANSSKNMIHSSGKINSLSLSLKDKLKYDFSKEFLSKDRYSKSKRDEKIKLNRLIIEYIVSIRDLIQDINIFVRAKECPDEDVWFFDRIKEFEEMHSSVEKLYAASNTNMKD